MYRIIIFIFLGLTFSAQAAVYKCQDENGRTIYSGTPCGDDSETVTIQQGPEGGSGLRESEKALIEEINKRREEQEAAAAEAAANAPRTGYNCKGIYISSFTPYSEDTVYRTGYGKGEIISERCAQAVLKLSGYDGRLGSSAVGDLLPRFTATLANGVQAQAQSITLSERGRLHKTENYTAHICFGNSRFEVADLKCN